MPRIVAQGDLLIEKVSDIAPCGAPVPAGPDGATVLAEGEVTGHRHAFYEKVTMFRDDALARDIPDGLYVGHVKIEDRPVALTHQEHAPITLDAGTYRVRRQRELEPQDARIIAD